MKKWAIIFAVLVVVAFLVWAFFIKEDSSSQNRYSFAEIKRGNLETLVSSTGILGAVSTLEVGTQVSGTISQVYVDFNNRVRVGQLLAVLDTTFLSAAVKDAEAGLVRSESQYEQEQEKFKSSQKLFEKGFISELDYISAKTSLNVARATLQSSRSSLDRAITNLKYAVIRSPINGTVINRNVERGQTVAASFSTPTLFTIAEDLSKMQILAQVDESDIGQIKEGQSVSFTVQAYPDKNFEGTVRQIRLQPETVQNVVNYTVVVDAKNEKGLLLPGMTATVDFQVDFKENVLLVPNIALRFQPSEEILAAYRAKIEKQLAQLPDSLKNRFGGQGQGGSNRQQMAQRFQPQSGGNGSMPKTAQLWYLDDNNEPTASRVFLGETDGKMTEIVRGRSIKEGMKIISGITTPEAQTQARSTNPLNPTQGMGGRRPF